MASTSSGPGWFSTSRVVRSSNGCMICLSDAPQEADALVDGLEGGVSDRGGALSVAGEHPVELRGVLEQGCRPLADRGELGDDELNELLLKVAVTATGEGILDLGERSAGEHLEDRHQVGDARLALPVEAHDAVIVGDRAHDF